MIYAIYAACVAAILWGLWPVALRKWREVRQVYEASKPAKPVRKWDEFEMPLNCRCSVYGPLGETNIDYDTDELPHTGPR